LKRPFIGGDVMQRQQKKMFFRRKAPKRCPDHQIGGKVERTPRLRFDELLEFRARHGSFRARKFAENGRPWAAGLNFLGGDLSPGPELGSQNLVPEDQLLQGRLECRPMQRPGYMKAQRKIVGRVIGIELIQKPEALLRKRERRRRVSGRLLNGRAASTLCVWASDGGGHCANNPFERGKESSARPMTRRGSEAGQFGVEWLRFTSSDRRLRFTSTISMFYLWDGVLVAQKLVSAG
jgi:hypothetical protein